MLKQFFECSKSYMAVCFNYFLSIVIFLNIDILQGSVATRLRCDGIFKYELVAYLPVSLPLKEFWKSVNISGSYGQEFGVLFFSETQCRCATYNSLSRNLLGPSSGAGMTPLPPPLNAPMDGGWDKRKRRAGVVIERIPVF